jgi:hypothetical protein
MRRWTAKAALARTRKNIAGAIERLRAVALEFGDIDQYLVDQAEEEIRALESFLEATQEYLTERIAEDPEFGL